jgi:hypothetical protein
MVGQVWIWWYYYKNYQIIYESISSIKSESISSKEKYQSCKTSLLQFEARIQKTFVRNIVSIIRCWWRRWISATRVLSGSLCRYRIVKHAWKSTMRWKWRIKGMMKNHDIEQMENHGESHYHKKTREPVELFMPTQKKK